MRKKPSQAFLANQVNSEGATLSRRDFLMRGGAGFGALALAYLGHLDTLSAATSRTPLAPKHPHLPKAARSVIFVFLEGGPSHIDLFDPKPELNRLAGQTIPPSYKRVITAMGEFESSLLAAPRTWDRFGQSGTWVSEWLPHTSKIVDDIAVIRSCWCDGLNHVGSVCQMNTGSTLAGRPSLGSWVLYGLGTENSNLPAFMVLTDRSKQVVGGTRNWGPGFMPASYQGTLLQPGKDPLQNLNPAFATSRGRQADQLNYLNRLNRRYAKNRAFQSELDARINAYELAYRMQMAAPEMIDLSHEPTHIRNLYGLDDKPTSDMARSCLLARRMVEQGVRFIQIYCGAGSRWDAHSGIEKNHSTLCRESDQPIAALIQDLKQRGLLDQTLVVWGGEFGRTPMSEKGDGRDHNPTGFTMWMAGGGVQGGLTLGATDDLGLHAVEDRVHVHDLHATILHLMGLDHMKLTYAHNGRRENPTINSGEVIRKILKG